MICNSPTKLSYVICATADEISTHNITNYDYSVTPKYSSLFGINETGLVVKIAQGTKAIPPISTSGLYFINNPNSGKTIAGVKLLVVRK